MYYLDVNFTTKFHLKLNFTVSFQSHLRRFTDVDLVSCTIHIQSSAHWQYCEGICSVMTIDYLYIDYLLTYELGFRVLCVRR